MIVREGARMVLSGPVTLANVAAVLEEGRRHLEDGVESVDLAGVTEMDSALLALLLAWMREAKSRDRSLTLANPPQALSTIARLYGVDTLLGHP
ncbi:MAG: putative binding protein (contains domain) [Burkholderiales bacterium]|jgi:phospholipid transport system transporter-binding protein|nr:putative binding protein (contains domain) [Burkholderiales bacterium]